MAAINVYETRQQTLGGGSFYGSIQQKWEQCDAIFTDLQHSSPRKLPSHSHELPFFALLTEGSYGERYNHRETQFGPFTIMFRPAGVPHQDEIGPNGVRFFEIEVRPVWRKRIAECSGELNLAHDDCHGGELFWLGMRLFREMHPSAPVADLGPESLLAEMLGCVARLPRERTKDAPAWLIRVIGKLSDEFCQRLTLDELSREGGVHPVHLSRVFRKCVGQGIGEYVHRLRIREACRLILTPGLTLADISFATGFADQSHFTRIFRRITGMKPGAFRNLIDSSRAGTRSDMNSRGSGKSQEFSNSGLGSSYPGWGDA